MIKKEYVSIILCFSLMLSLIPLQLFTSAQNQEQQVAELIAIEDSWVNGGSNSDRNYGTDRNIKIKRTSTENRDAFLKFDLTQISGKVHSAELKLYVLSLESATPDGYHIEARGIDDNLWSESAITYNNAPEAGGEVLDTAFVGQDEIGTYVTFDVTDFINEKTGQLASIRLRGVETSRGGDFATKENSNENPPYLHVVFTEGDTQELDEERPSTPTAVTAVNVKHDQVEISWEESTDNVGVVGYKISRDGIGVGTASSPSFTDTGLNPGTIYTYTVQAFDEAGNYSLESNELIVTTLDKEMIGIVLEKIKPMTLADHNQPITVLASYNDGSLEVVEEDLFFTSSNKEVAEVSEAGIITALSIGDTEITVSYKDYQSPVHVLHVYYGYYQNVAIEDTYVEASKTSPQGSESTFKIKKTSTENRDAFLKFTVPELNGLLESAKLRLYVTKLDSNTTSYEIGAQGIKDNTWSEGTLVYSNVPLEDGVSLGSATVNKANEYVYLDVTEYLRGYEEGIVSFRLRGITSGLGADYATKEHKDQSAYPVLIIATSEPQPPSVPENVQLAAGDAKITITWDEAENANAYTIERSTKEAGPYEVIVENLQTTTFVDRNLENEITYYYKVKSLNNFGESDFSSVVTATPQKPLLVKTPVVSNMKGNIPIKELNKLLHVIASVEITNSTQNSLNGEFIISLVASDGSVASITSVKKHIDSLETIDLQAGFTLPNQFEDYELRIFAIDEEGNLLSNESILSLDEFNLRKKID
ncbi:DNRLRE domain-containing protein [Anaerobacillus sp. CMMVII]|uniref:CBM96 family carbohydrate-binding protein n=1 Tax=Anaerobacillus sp. CMMVII TaxID=2755588 RepID=UPI0021B7ABF1|nr:DNRLRE domain-containing protein [Anaerobacillus sp. CMMVII]MCT8137064.1 DNRLRE domain-containing protein [Anaerobacillus sp. CMMVII]